MVNFSLSALLRIKIPPPANFRRTSRRTLLPPIFISKCLHFVAPQGAKKCVFTVWLELILSEIPERNQTEEAGSPPPRGLGKAKKQFFWGKRIFRFASASIPPAGGVWGGMRTGFCRFSKWLEKS